MQGSDEASHASLVPTLADLITARKKERGWSYAQLAHRAGDVLSAQRWQQLGTGVRIKEFPEPATLAAMADALDIDVSVVVLAAAKSTGLDVRNDLSLLAQQLPASAARLEPDARNAIVALVRAITKETQHDEEQESRTETGSAEHGRPAGGDRARRSPSMKRNKVTPLNPPNQGSDPSPGDMPPWDESKELAAFRPDPDDVE